MRSFQLSALRVSVVIYVFIAIGSARAERFLTVDQALKVCFPTAAEFKASTIQLQPGEIKAIERESGVKVKRKEVRIWTGKEGCLMWDQVIGKHDFIDYVVAISTNGSVRQAEILEYREHYGGQVRQPKWREQFAGKNASAPLKLGKDIYNITGATLSCRHVTEGVKRLLATFELVVRPRLLADGELRPPE